MSVKKRKKKSLRTFSVSQKHEAVLAKRRGLTDHEMRSLFGASPFSVRRWVAAYDEKGIAGLENAPRGGRVGEVSVKTAAAESVLEEVTREEPESGVSKARGALYRRGLLSLARETVRRLLRRKGRGPILGRSRRRNKPVKKRFFERAKPNELWQSDIMTFMLKGQYRVYLIGFLDDHSRFIVGWGLYRFQTSANVMEVFRAGLEKHGMPKEVLTDNGRQYYTWRGKSKFTKLLLKLGIRHIRSRPYHPQTLGKIESFWRNLLQERLTQVPLASFEEAEAKIGEYVEYYNFKRPHQGIGNMMPSDRYYEVAGQVKQIIEGNTARVEEEKEPAPEYRPPAYLVGNLGGKELRVVAKDAEVTLQDARPEEVESGSDGSGADAGDSLEAEKADPGLGVSRSLQQEEGSHVGTLANQASQPSGEAGSDPAGPVAEADGKEPVPAGGSIEGSVLPVAKAGEGGGPEGAGGEGARPEGHQAGDGGEGAEEGAGAHPEAKEGEGEAAQGAGPREGGVADSQAHHQAPGMGPVAGAGE